MPMISNGTAPILTAAPMGSLVPKRIRAVVGPSSATRRRSWSSCSVIPAPCAASMFRIASPTAVVPSTVTVVLTPAA